MCDKALQGKQMCDTEEDYYDACEPCYQGGIYGYLSLFSVIVFDGARFVDRSEPFDLDVIQGREEPGAFRCAHCAHPFQITDMDGPFDNGDRFRCESCGDTSTWWVYDFVDHNTYQENRSESMAAERYENAAYGRDTPYDCFDEYRPADYYNR